MDIVPLLEPREDVLDCGTVSNERCHALRSIFRGQQRRLRDFHRKSLQLLLLTNPFLLLPFLFLLFKLRRSSGITVANHLQKSILTENLHVLLDGCFVLTSLGDRTTIFHFKSSNQIVCLSTHRRSLNSTSDSLSTFPTPHESESTRSSRLASNSHSVR